MQIIKTADQLTEVDGVVGHYILVVIESELKVVLMLLVTEKPLEKKTSQQFILTAQMLETCHFWYAPPPESSWEAAYTETWARSRSWTWEGESSSRSLWAGGPGLPSAPQLLWSPHRSSTSTCGRSHRSVEDPVQHGVGLPWFLVS